MTPPIGSTPPTGAILPLQARTAAGLWSSGSSPLDVVPLRHPIIEALGHPPSSDYGEQFWLPVIGPSSLCAYRRLASRFTEAPRGFTVDLSKLGPEIGLGTGTGRNSPIVRALIRIVDYHLAEVVDGRLGVYTSLPPLSRRQAARLPDHLAARHGSIVGRTAVEDNRRVGGSVAEAGR
jgi:hypothetical protein